MVHEVDRAKTRWNSRDATADQDSDSRVYLLSIYYVISTIATVGYGDITSNNVGIIESWIVERSVGCVVVIFGVLIYTNTVGFISSSLMDSKYIRVIQ